MVDLTPGSQITITNPGVSQITLASWPGVMIPQSLLPVTETDRYHPINYGAACDGVTDDAAAIQATIDAAAAAGGGTVDLGDVYGWTGDLVVKDGALLAGRGANGATASTLKALDSTARIRLGVWGADEHPAGMRDLRIDGNGTGDPTGILRIQCALATISDVTISDAAGHGVVYDACQNLLVSALNVFNVGGGAFVFDNGSGGIQMLRCESRGNNGHVLLTDTQAEANAYPFGSAHNDIKHCIFETGGTSPAYMIRVHAGGTLNRFSDCGFSVNGADTVASGYMVEIDNPIYNGIVAPQNLQTMVTIDSAYMVGGAAMTKGFLVTASNGLVMTGRSTLQQMAVAWESSGASFGQLDGSFEFTTVTDRFNPSGAGNFVNWMVQRLGTNSWKLPAEAPYVEVAQRESDSAFRYFRDRDGTLAWSDGSSGVSKVTQIYNSTTDTLNTSAARFTGKVIADANQYATITAAGSTATCSAATKVHLFAMSGSGTITTMVGPTSPANGQELEIWIIQIGSGRTYVWASNMKFAGNVAPSDTTNNTATIVKFRWYAAAARWIETGRSVAVPYS